ncbi:MAG: hypothetical protein OXT67_03500 [Zetaproteobacteria bacterium]|nr:hypothetical protein [Zetaproteobacteria bacterium]
MASRQGRGFEEGSALSEFEVVFLSGQILHLRLEELERFRDKVIKRYQCDSSLSGDVQKVKAIHDFFEQVQFRAYLTKVLEVLNRRRFPSKQELQCLLFSQILWNHRKSVLEHSQVLSNSFWDVLHRRQLVRQVPSKKRSKSDDSKKCSKSNDKLRVQLEEVMQQEFKGIELKKKFLAGEVDAAKVIAFFRGNSPEVICDTSNEKFAASSTVAAFLGARQNLRDFALRARVEAQKILKETSLLAHLENIKLDPDTAKWLSSLEFEEIKLASNFGML